MTQKIIHLSLLLFAICFAFSCQKKSSLSFHEHAGNNGMHENNIERKERYNTDGESFVIRNGGKLFNRSLYGGNTQFRVVGGDVPEFFLFDGGKEGVLRIGIIQGEESKWIQQADLIETRYTPGKLTYTIIDRLLGDGKVVMTVLAGHDPESILIEINAKGKIKGSLVFMYGAASGVRFFRNGDINTETSDDIFLLHTEECKGNRYLVTGNSFYLDYTSRNTRKKLKGIMLYGSETKLVNAEAQQFPLSAWKSREGEMPALMSLYRINTDGPQYMSIEIISDTKDAKQISLPKLAYEQAEAHRVAIANRITIETPDIYMNPLGGVWATVANACWEDPTWLHGAIGWRVRLNGWRVGYLGNFLGWHERSKAHFQAYFKSQIIASEGDSIMPGAKENLAREAKDPRSRLYSNGYISTDPNGKIKRNHYDMNMVFIDALLWHLQWTGDMDFARQSWPVIVRHLDWEKRCFDPDNDGLYDAYCCIWASDALQYSGGSVAHSSSYHYRANKMAASLAKRLGQNPQPYEEEANRIYNALQNKLWLKDKGVFAEFQDREGNKLLHTSPALWSIYHLIDNQVPDKFQSYLMTRYVDTQIPHIPVKAPGIPEGLSTLSTTNWHPYSWSVNNVAFAEVAHTALAYWQTGRAEEAFKLWKANILDFMYLGTTPGNIGQISYYDAARGETYSDFSDPAGIGARTLIEGLFGIVPDALQGELLWKPGMPASWDSTNVSTPDFDLHFKRDSAMVTYRLTQKMVKPMNLRLVLRAEYDRIDSVHVNGVRTIWKNVENIGTPAIEIVSEKPEQTYEVVVKFSGNLVVSPVFEEQIVAGGRIAKQLENGMITQMYDPQNILQNESFQGGRFDANCTSQPGFYTIFLKVQQGAFWWWLPYNLEVKAALELVAESKQLPGQIAFRIKNNTKTTINGDARIHIHGKAKNVNQEIAAGALGEPVVLKQSYCVPGTNNIDIQLGSYSVSGTCLNWNIPLRSNVEKIDISRYFNDNVTQIYRNEYLSPRPNQVTLQLPKHGYGNWCHYNDHPLIDDAGLRAMAGEKGEFSLVNGLGFVTPQSGKNIVFCSQWDNYPNSFTIPLQGRASHAYLLMAGSTNHMQSRIVNGNIVMEYTDGSKTILPLINPDNWWSIEQDMHIDDYAFKTGAPSPLRINLMTGEAYTVGKGIGTEKLVDGGMASVLDIPLHAGKELKSLTVEAVANDVIIGLMGVSLIR